MPLVLASAVNISQPININAFEVSGFSVNSQAGILDISYSVGNMSTDTPPVFMSVGDVKNLHLAGADFATFLGANPTLYPVIKAALYAAIAVAEGLTGGTVV